MSAGAGETKVDRAAIVTGVESEPGRAVAELLSGRGYGLTLAGADGSALAAVGEALRADGGRVQEITGSLGEEDSVVAIVAAHRERYGRCDFLLNGAAIGIHQKIGELTMDRVDEQLAVNLRGPAFFYRECLPMLEQAADEHGQALVVNNASIDAHDGIAGLSTYAACKAAIVSFNECMHLEISRRGIKSTALMPDLSAIETDAPGRPAAISGADIAAVVAYLLSLSAATVVPEVRFLPTGSQG